MQRRFLAGSLVAAVALTARSSAAEPERASAVAAPDAPFEAEPSPVSEPEEEHDEPATVGDEPPLDDGGEPEPDDVGVPEPITTQDVLDASWDHSCADAALPRPLEQITLLETGASALGLASTTEEFDLVMLVDDVPEAHGDVTGDGHDDYTFRTSCVENATSAFTHFATLEVWTTGDDGRPVQLPRLLSNDWRAEGLAVAQVLVVDGGLEVTFEWVGEPGPPIVRRYPWNPGSSDWDEWQPVGATPGM